MSIAPNALEPAARRLRILFIAEAATLALSFGRSS